MKKFYCDYCKSEIEEARYDNQVVKINTTAVVHYQYATTAEYHFHNDCFKTIEKIIKPG